MHKKTRIWTKGIWIGLGLIVLGSLLYWQYNKKKLLQSTIQKEVLKGTDSLYRISYDSSYIDEVRGDVRFYNISMQSDSLLENFYSNDSNLSANIFKIHIKQVNILGADIPSFLSNTAVKARQIDIIAPRIEVIQTGKKNPGTISREDSLALYERITGKFNRIHTERINIQDAEIKISDSTHTTQTSIKGLTIGLNQLIIDSTHDYENLISYFINDIHLNVAEFYQKISGAALSMRNFGYHAKEKIIQVEEIEKMENESITSKTKFLNLRLTGISTDDFIRNKKIHADSLATDGGILTLSINLTKSNGQTALEISNSFFESAWVKNIDIGSTDLYVHNKQTPLKKPLVLKNFKFSASGIEEIIDGKNLKKLIAQADWKFSADGLQIETADKKYIARIGPFELNKRNRSALIQYMSLTPTMSEAAFVRSLKEQLDLYNLRANNISLQGVDLETLLISQKLIARSGSLQPILKIFNDRTVPYSTTSKVGKYPQQQLMRMKFPIHIGILKVQNGHVSYRERGRKSKQIGDVFFSNVNGEIKNISNIPSYVQKNNRLVVQASAKFLGAGALHTTWNLILNAPDGAFTATGNCGPFNAEILSRITEPLGMAAITAGKINKLDFSMTGDDLKSKGVASLRYQDLKMSLLKPGADSTEELEKKSLASGLINLFMKSNNPNNGNLRTGKIDFERDVYKSFFNLLWKSIYDAVKDIAM